MPYNHGSLDKNTTGPTQINHTDLLIKHLLSIHNSLPYSPLRCSSSIKPSLPPIVPLSEAH